MDELASVLVGGAITLLGTLIGSYVGARAQLESVREAGAQEREKARQERQLAREDAERERKRESYLKVMRALAMLKAASSALPYTFEGQTKEQKLEWIARTLQPSLADTEMAIADLLLHDEDPSVVDLFNSITGRVNSIAVAIRLIEQGLGPVDFTEHQKEIDKQIPEAIRLMRQRLGVERQTGES